jgi:hypothetical protein
MWSADCSCSMRFWYFLCIQILKKKTLYPEFFIFTFGCCILLHSYPTGSLWCRQLQQSFNTSTYLLEFNHKKKEKSVAWVCERTIATEWPPLVGEVSTNFLRIEGATWSAWRIPTVVSSVFYIGEFSHIHLRQANFLFHMAFYIQKRKLACRTLYFRTSWKLRRMIILIF